MYRQVFEGQWILHFEPSLDALSLPSDVISSIMILSHRRGILNMLQIAGHFSVCVPAELQEALLARDDWSQILVALRASNVPAGLLDAMEQRRSNLPEHSRSAQNVPDHARSGQHVREGAERSSVSSRPALAPARVAFPGGSNTAMAGGEEQRRLTSKLKHCGTLQDLLALGQKVPRKSLGGGFQKSIPPRDSRFQKSRSP